MTAPWEDAVRAVAHDVGCGTAYAATHSWGGAAIGYRCDCDRDARIAKGLGDLNVFACLHPEATLEQRILVFAEASRG